jgi:hypothetical protein
MAGDYTSWHVGMKVVCVDDEWRDFSVVNFPCPLVAGAVYTIRSIQLTDGIYYGSRKLLTVCLNEVRNPYEAGFAAPRFRPVQTRKTDISIFTAMLRPIDAKLKETV